MKLLAMRRTSDMSVSSARSSISTTEHSGPAKLEDVTTILEKLSADLDKICLLPHQRDAHLEKLKVYGRDPTNADPIFTKDGIEVLSRHAFNSPSKSTSRNALRCLANAMLLKPKTRQMFVDMGCEAKACSTLKDGTEEDEFLISRVVFLTTYDTDINIRKLIDNNRLGEIVANRVGGHAKQYITKQKKVKELNPMEDMALTESLKLLFNMTHFCSERSSAFSQAVPHILTILMKRPISHSNPLQSPIAQLVNALINLDLQEKHNVSALFPKSNIEVHCARFVEILGLSMKVYKDNDIEQLISPLLTLLRRVYEIAPREVQRHLQEALLPNACDREQPVGRGEALSARLLQLSTNPSAPQAREAVSTLLFELSDRDAQNFVQNVGYGFASGFLFSHNVPIPENALEAYSTSSSEDKFARPSQQNSKAINPITGQTLQSEAKVDLPEMTQEEKEREAEKMFVLFERLKKNGVISVNNPVEDALQQGRFLELEEGEGSDTERA